jgi:hypothetical protein
MNAILDQIAAEAQRGSIHALRDYSVTLFYLFRGCDGTNFSVCAAMT